MELMPPFLIIAYRCLPASERNIWLSVGGTMAEPSYREGNICRLLWAVINPREALLPVPCHPKGQVYILGKGLFFF